MPRTGYHALTVKDSVYDLLKKSAKKEKRSVSGYIEHILLPFAKKGKEARAA